MKPEDFGPVKHTDKQYTELRSEHAFKDAEAKGCIVVTPAANELFVDIDSQEAMFVFQRTWAIVREKENLGPNQYRQTPSPSGEPFHYHIVIELRRDLPPGGAGMCERILLQCLLGSDPMREALSWKRVGLGDITPTLFFEKKPEPEVEQVNRKPPTVQAKATYIRGMWDLKIKCPYCSKEHSHGGGIGVEPEYGHRASHCSFSEEQAKDAGSFAGYILIPRAVTA